MLLNLHKKNWTHGLTLKNYDEHTEENEEMMKVIRYLNIFVLLII